MSEAAIRLEVAISVLADGRVVFCDLPADLAQVRDVLAGESVAEQTTCRLDASQSLAAVIAAPARGESPA